MAVALVALLGGGCGNDDAPSAPSTPATIDTFPSGDIRLAYRLDLPTGTGPLPRHSFPGAVEMTSPGGAASTRPGATPCRYHTLTRTPLRTSVVDLGFSRGRPTAAKRQ